ncbi:unnamed protein product [Victoria cruziana]
MRSSTTGASGLVMGSWAMISAGDSCAPSPATQHTQLDRGLERRRQHAGDHQLLGRIARIILRHHVPCFRLGRDLTENESEGALLHGRDLTENESEGALLHGRDLTENGRKRERELPAKTEEQSMG